MTAVSESLRFNKKLVILTLSLLLLGTSFSAVAQEKKALSFPISQYKLKNGLQVILAEDYSLPLVSVVVAYNVGSINEQPGKTGLAYLLENLMFQGSKNVSRMQHISLIHRVGGELNATTREDKTIFYQTVPSNQLARVLWLESDRMKSLEINSLNVEQAKGALIEELHHRKETEPYLESFWKFDQLLYPSFAYSHPVIGNEADLRNLTVEDVTKFYSTFYRPNNAILSIAGNLNRIKTIEDIKKFFETIPAGKEIPSPPRPKSFNKKPASETLKGSLAPSPGFHLGYELASPLSDEFYTLVIIEYVLLRGQTSRLYKKLIKKEPLASYLSGGIEIRKDISRFKIFAINNNRIMVERSKKAIFSEINKLKSSFISEKELTKFKNMFKRDYLNRYASSKDKALSLAETLLSKKRLVNLSEELEKYRAVTPSDIIAIINRYFTKKSIILDIRRK